MDRHSAPRAGAPRAAVAASLAAAAAVALASHLGTAPAAGQTPRWEAELAYEHQRIDSDLPRWSDWSLWTAGLRRRVGFGSVAVEGLVAERFGGRDAAAAVDVYADLGDRTYVHVRPQLAPSPEALPEHDHAVELFHATEDGWEGSVGYRYLAFGDRSPAPPVHVLSTSLARYLPSWYLRGRLDVNPSFDEVAAFGSAAARRYIAGQDGFVELAGGGGQEVVDVAAGPSVDIRGSRFVGARGRLFTSRRFGFSLSLRHHDVDGLPGRLAGGASAIVRW